MRRIKMMEIKLNGNADVCPYCGAKLDKGILYTSEGRGLFFLRRLPKLHMFMSGNKLSKEDGSIVLDGVYKCRVNHTEISASVCRSCEVIIHFYGKS